MSYLVVQFNSKQIAVSITATKIKMLIHKQPLSLLVISLALTGCNTLQTQPTPVTVKQEQIQFDYIEVAKANGHPAPTTVLSHKQQLNLTPDQLHQTQQLHTQSQKHLAKLKKQLQTKQATLKQLFETRQANDDLVAELLAEIGIKESKIRYVELGAQIKQRGILSPQQLNKLQELTR
jgi:Spy/CpxP family protein refolding chaperone